MSLIFDSAGTSPVGEALATGITPGEGTYFCLACGSQLSLRETDRLPECPRCGASRFRRDSIFASRQEHGTPTVEFAASKDPEPPAWLEEARDRLGAEGYHLVCRDRGEIKTFALEPGWTHIGRFGGAEICLDDTSVSRRHALVSLDPGERPRLLDDRSLNGVTVNGRQIEWTDLEPGDEIAIGRFRLFLLQA